MGWGNGPPSWAEMERVLDGKPRHTRAAGMPADREPTEPRPERPPPVGPTVPYAELHAHSAYSFLDGASTPQELVVEAARLGLRAIALTDHNGLYGVVRFAEAAAELDMATVFGA
ncbi:PHP domain-containing protein, partial [Mycolicibacter senuensis]|uniref:PHP domain-containing protein n=1 Tax=Mycolicibacter senuensis TaxID=386913 RepID=UPI000DCB244D